jgi:chemotaxis protein MotB
MIPKRKQQHEESIDSWLMSYADMITLLMCFFIIFVSVSEPKKERISALASGMGGKFGTVDLSTPFNGVMRALKGVVETNQAFDDLAVESNDRFVFVELASDSFFTADSAELAADKLPLLKEVIDALKTVDFLAYSIHVEAHTSDVPPGEAYASNWELSSARAARVVRLFIEAGLQPDKLRAVGYGDSKPKVPNLDVKGEPIAANRVKNSRILIKLDRAE